MATTAADDDRVLIARAAAGDPGSLASLYRRHGPSVFGLAHRITASREAAEEVTQDVFERVWRAAGSYRSERSSVATWIMRIARNRSIDEMRRSGRRPTIALGNHEDGLESGSGADPVEMTSEAMERRRVRAALGRIPAAQRRAVELAYFGGFTHSQIADVAGEPVGTIKTRIRLGLRRLRDVLGDDGGVG